MALSHPADFLLFRLMPLNEEAARLVRANGKSCGRGFEFSAAHVSKRGNGRLAHVGCSPNENDIVTMDRFAPVNQCYFTYTAHGDLVLCDSFERSLTTLKAYSTASGAMIPKYCIRRPGDHCVLPMTWSIRFTIDFTGPLFELQWLVRLDEASVDATRRKLAGSHSQRVHGFAGMSGRPLRDCEPARAETMTELTPQVTPRFSRRPIMEVFEYKVLGRGGFGVVKQVVDIRTGRVYAMKEINWAAMSRYGLGVMTAMENFRDEVEKYAKFNHKHLVKMEGHQGWTFQRPVQIFMKLYDGDCTKIATSIRSDHVFPASRAEYLPNFLIHCLSALEYLHKNRTVHMDVKLENILYKSGRVDSSKTSFFLSDLGISAAAWNASGKCGDMRYLAPELATFAAHPAVRPVAQPSSDIYSFALAVLEILGMVSYREFYTPVDSWRDKLRQNGFRGGYADSKVPGVGHYGHSRIDSLRKSGLLKSPTLERMLDPFPTNRPSARTALEGLAVFYSFKIPADTWI